MGRGIMTQSLIADESFPVAARRLAPRLPERTLASSYLRITAENRRLRMSFLPETASFKLQHLHLVQTDKHFLEFNCF